MLRWQVAAKGVLQKHISATICISQVYRFPVSDGTCDGEYRKTPRTCFLRRIGRINTPSQENQNGQIRYTCVSSFPYSPFASRSLAVSQPISFHTGSVSRDSVPLLQVVSQQPFRQASLVRIPRPVPFHTGSISCDSVPLR